MFTSSTALAFRRIPSAIYHICFIGEREDISDLVWAVCSSHRKIHRLSWFSLRYTRYNKYPNVRRQLFQLHDAWHAALASWMDVDRFSGEWNKSQVRLRPCMNDYVQCMKSNRFVKWMRFGKSYNWRHLVVSGGLLNDGHKETRSPRGQLSELRYFKGRPICKGVFVRGRQIDKVVYGCHRQLLPSTDPKILSVASVAPALYIVRLQQYSNLTSFLLLKNL